MKRPSELARLTREQNWELFLLAGELSKLEHYGFRRINSNVAGSTWLRHATQTYISALTHYRDNLKIHHASQRTLLKAQLTLTQDLPNHETRNSKSNPS
jgi:hypothetical protein